MLLHSLFLSSSLSCGELCAVRVKRNVICTPFHQHRLALILTLISNYIHDKVWDQITHPFPSISGTIYFAPGLDLQKNTMLAATTSKSADFAMIHKDSHQTRP